jgi:molecular chaperone GrpE
VTDRPTDRPKIHVTDRRGAPKDPAHPATAPASQPPLSGAAGKTPEQLSPTNEELKQLADDRLDQLMRLKADFENFRKRELREKTELVERASFRVVENLLPVLDDFERAIDALRTHTDDDGLIRGLELVLTQLRGVLEREGLERVTTQGAFDPHEHEAVASIPGDVPEPTVLEVVRPGYKLRGKTIRPALVQVAVPTEATPERSGGEGERRA